MPQTKFVLKKSLELGLNPIVVYGTEKQKMQYLPPVNEGKVKACFGVTEPNTGLNTTELKTRAVLVGDRDVVHGQKVWISTAQVAEKIVEGKLGKWFEEHCLLEQQFVKNDEVTIGELVAGVSGVLGEKVRVRRFARFALGEE